MIYKYSEQVEDDFISDVLRLDALVFAPSDQGTDSSIRARYNANQESLVLAYNNSEIIGYICFFPVTNDLSERIKNEESPFDDNIQPSDILASYKNKHDFDVFLISAAISPEYQGKGTGTELVNKCLAFLSDKIKSGCKIRKAYSYAFSDAGARVLAKTGFKELKGVRHSDSGNIVKLMYYCFADYNKLLRRMFMPE